MEAVCSSGGGVGGARWEQKEEEEEWEEGQVWGAEEGLAWGLAVGEDGAMSTGVLCGRECGSRDKGKAAMIPAAAAYDGIEDDEDDEGFCVDKVEALFQKVVLLQEDLPADNVNEATRGDQVLPRLADSQDSDIGGVMNQTECCGGGHVDDTTAVPECSICYEALDSFDIAFVSGCMHVYCIDCILKWCALTNNKYEQQRQQQQRRDHAQGNVRVAGTRTSAGDSGVLGSSSDGDSRVIWCPTCKGSVNSLLTYRRCFDDALCDDLQEETVHWWMITRNNKAENASCCFEDEHCEDDYHYDEFAYGDDEYGCFKDAGLVKRGKMMGLASKKKKKKMKAPTGSGGGAGCSRDGHRSIMISNRPFGKNGYTSSQGRQFARPIGRDASNDGASTSSAAASSSSSTLPAHDQTDFTQTKCESDAEPSQLESASPDSGKAKQSFVSPATLKRQAKKEKKMERELLKLEKRRAKMSSSPLLSKSPSSWTRTSAKTLTENLEEGQSTDESGAVASGCT